MLQFTVMSEQPLETTMTATTTCAHCQPYRDWAKENAPLEWTESRKTMSPFALDVAARAYGDCACRCHDAHRRFCR